MRLSVCTRVRGCPFTSVFCILLAAGELNNLTWLDLSLNSISGSLPTEFGRIQNIEVINLQMNQLQASCAFETSSVDNVHCPRHTH